MTDFYTRLEEQLVTAGRRRAGRGAVRRAVAGRRPQLLAATALVAVVIAAASILPSVLSSSDGGAGAPAPKPAPAGPVRTPDATNLKGIRVAVLNATTRPGLAGRVAGRLQSRGATIGEVGDARVQTLQRTNVTYRRGSETIARRVAVALGVDLVAPYGPDAEATGADVVVFVGGDGGILLPAGAPVPIERGGTQVPVRVERAAISFGLTDVSCSGSAVDWRCTGRKAGIIWRCRSSNEPPAAKRFVLRCAPAARLKKIDPQTGR